MDYDIRMHRNATQTGYIEQRLALLRQRERELLIKFSQSHATLAETDAIEAELLAVAEQIAELESTLPPALGMTA